MIGAWGQQGLTEELFDRDTRSPTLCVSAYNTEMRKIQDLEDLDPEDTSGGNYSFSTMQRDDTLEDRRAAAVVELKKCNERMRRIAAINREVAFQDKARRLRREAEAQATLEAQMGLTPQKKGFSPWLIPLLALIPLGFLLFRRKV
jgi:hypothetical protein